MEQTIQLAAVCLICAVMGLLIKGTSPALAFCLSLTACVVILLWVGARTADMVGMATALMGQTGLDEEMFMPLCKVVAIGLLCHLGEALCRDAGESALASVMNVTGTVLCLTVSLPLLEAVWNLLAGLL